MSAHGRAQADKASKVLIMEEHDALHGKLMHVVLASRISGCAGSDAGSHIMLPPATDEPVVRDAAVPVSGKPSLIATVSLAVLSVSAPSRKMPYNDALQALRRP